MHGDRRARISVGQRLAADFDFPLRRLAGSNGLSGINRTTWFDAGLGMQDSARLKSSRRSDVNSERSRNLRGGRKICRTDRLGDQLDFRQVKRRHDQVNR